MNLSQASAQPGFNDDRALTELAATIDQAHFFGRLARIGYEYRCLGKGLYGTFSPKRGVSINWALRDDPMKLRCTLIHEMIHAHLWVLQDPCAQARNDGHGAAFAAEVQRLMSAGEDISGELDYAVCSNVDAEAVARAAASYWARQSRDEHPEGKFDGGGRWEPSTHEWQVCCEGVRLPSRQYPYSYMTHCRTIAHIGRLHGVDTSALRWMVNKEKRFRQLKMHAGGQQAPAVQVIEKPHHPAAASNSSEATVGKVLFTIRR